MKLWISSALTASGHEYGAVAVVAATREEATVKVRAALARQSAGAQPDQRYIDNLADNLEATLSEYPEGVFIDWSPVERR